MTLEQAIEVLTDRYNSSVTRRRTDAEWRLATDTAIAALRGPEPDPATGLEGCWHCRNIEAHRIEYVIAVRTKGGTPMNTPGDCPYHYCPACGRKVGKA